MSKTLKNMLDLSESSKWSAKKHSVWTDTFCSKPECLFFPFVKHKGHFFFQEWPKCSRFSFVLYLICSYSHCSYSNYAYLKNTQGPNKSHVWICSRTNDDEFQFVLHTKLLNDYWNIGRSCVDYYLSFFFFCSFCSFCNLTAPEHSSKKASHTGLEQSEGD